MSCKWDRDAKDYLIDGEPCRRDDYGDPTHHCTARRTCSAHVGNDERTCARCIGRVRANLKHIPLLSALTLPVAVTLGVNSQAANLAGPAADPADWSERRIAVRSHLATWEKLGRISETQHLRARIGMEDDDEGHPLNVLGRWCLMIAEDYGHDLPTPLTVSSAADYLTRMLPRVAQDSTQDFPLLMTEVRKCRRHMESAIAITAHHERGVPCPECVVVMQDKRAELAALGVPENEWPKLAAPRLIRKYAHWCDDEDCCQVHHDTDAEDTWVCPRDHAHTWTHEDYTRRLVERKTA